MILHVLLLSYSNKKFILSFNVSIKNPDILSGFFVFDALGITPVVPAFSIAVFAYSYLEHPALYVPMIGN